MPWTYFKKSCFSKQGRVWIAKKRCGQSVLSDAGKGEARTIPVTRRSKELFPQAPSACGSSSKLTCAIAALSDEASVLVDYLQEFAAEQSFGCKEDVGGCWLDF